MNESGSVAAGIDTHKDEHALCVIDRVGRVVKTGTYAADPAGYDGIAAAIGGPGGCAVVGVEGTGSYGAGVARRLAELGYDVVEVVRPGRDRRRAGEGKSDPADAERAARDALAGRASGAPRAGTGWVEALRLREVAREAAVAESTRAANRVRALVVTAPAPVREGLRGMGTPALMRRLSRRRRARGEPERSLWDSLRTLALSWRAAKEAAAEHEGAMRAILEANAPALLGVPCCGAVSAARLAIAAGDNPGRMSGEAAFASLCGASPVEASSGRVRRHRLNRGGDRRANCALHTIARQRMRRDERTRPCVEKRTRDGKTRREIERILVRYIAREVYRALMRPQEAGRPSCGEAAAAARSERLRIGATQAQAASALGVASARISELERCVRVDGPLLRRYLEWLGAMSPE
ncbi:MULTISPECIES: IS110 family transposase, partial [unclassified Adlercreutzia]|uniref:IS110 family transposase n=1 Tax=unclassified Adlercreutzia TaxID=2636013 RepID=UPI0013ED7C36